LGDAARERRPPKAARTKHVPQTLNPARFGGRFGGRDWRCSNNASEAHLSHLTIVILSATCLISSSRPGHLARRENDVKLFSAMFRPHLTGDAVASRVTPSPARSTRRRAIGCYPKLGPPTIFLFNRCLRRQIGFA
jgi:hypothetical protein